MASFKKTANGKWEVQVARKGLRKSGTFESKREGTLWANKIESEFMGSKQAHSGKTLGDLLTRYSKEKSPDKGGGKMESYRINKLLQYPVMKTKLKSLDATHLSEWRDARLKEVSSGTVIRDMSTLSSALKVAAKEWKWIERSPLEDISRPKKPEARDRRPTEDEIDRILFALGYEYDEKPERIGAKAGACYLFAIETGMRLGELCQLTIENVHLDRRVAHVRAVTSKGGVKRDVPLSTEAMRIVRQMDTKEGLTFGISSRQATVAFMAATERAMIDDLTFHDSRHEAITRLAKKMGPLQLARIVGHKNLNQLMTYYNESADNLAKDLD